TRLYQSSGRTFCISIHASQAGCDLLQNLRSPDSGYFNPRIPSGMRRVEDRAAAEPPQFQSTHPKRDATALIDLVELEVTISIHASQAGCDQAGRLISLPRPDFNPRIPSGMRPPLYPRLFRLLLISIHASQAGCDVRGGG